MKEVGGHECGQWSCCYKTTIIKQLPSRSPRTAPENINFPNCTGTVPGTVQVPGYRCTYIQVQVVPVQVVL